MWPHGVSHGSADCLCLTFCKDVKNAPDKPLREYVKRGHSWSGMTPPDSSWEALNWPLRDVTAALESGIVRGVSVFVEGIKRTDLLKSIWLFLMERISPRLIPVSNARTMMRWSSRLVLWSNRSFSPASNLLVLALSAFGKEIIFTGFCGIEMPQSLDAIVKTRLRIVSSLLREEGETSWSRISRLRGNLFRCQMNESYWPQMLLQGP